MVCDLKWKSSNTITNAILLLQFKQISQWKLMWMCIVLLVYIYSIFFIIYFILLGFTINTRAFNEKSSWNGFLVRVLWIYKSLIFNTKISSSGIQLAFVLRGQLIVSFTDTLNMCMCVKLYQPVACMVKWKEQTWCESSAQTDNNNNRTYYNEKEYKREWRVEREKERRNGFCCDLRYG